MKVDTPTSGSYCLRLLYESKNEAPQHFHYTDMTSSQQHILNIFRLVKPLDIDIMTLLHAVKP